MSRMAPDQRREQIERMLAEDPAVSQQSIAAACGVSQNTISVVSCLSDEPDAFVIKRCSHVLVKVAEELGEFVVYR